MKRKHYLLSVEIGGVTNYAVRNLACIVGYKLTTDESKAETFGESIRKRWLAQYPSGKAVEVGDEKRPDLEELRQIKRELHGPLKPRAVKFGPKPPPKFGPKKPRAVKFGPRKPGPADQRGTAIYSQPLAAKRAVEDAQRLEVMKNPIFVSMEEDTPRGYEPISPTHIPGNYTREQLREWFLRNTGRLPIIPADVKDGVAWARARAVEAADEAFRIMMQTGGARVWAYFRPVDREDAPLTTEKFGANLRVRPDESMVTYALGTKSTAEEAKNYRKKAAQFWETLSEYDKQRVADSLGKYPIFVEDRSLLTSRLGGKGLPISNEVIEEVAKLARSFFKDAPLSTEKFGANLRFAPVGTIVRWQVPNETSKRVYRKMGAGKFDWKEILPGPQGWRPTSTRGELVLRNILANYNQAPAQFSILFPSDPKAEIYELAEGFSESASRAAFERADQARQDQPEQARKYADMFLDILNAHGGASLHARAWHASGVGARVYLKGDLYVSFSSGGDISKTNRGVATYLPSAFRPNERKVIEESIKIYNKQRRIEPPRLSEERQILKAEAAELEQQEKAKKAREAEREKMAREVDAAIKESREKEPSERDRYAQMVRDEPMRDFWDQWHTWANRRNTMQNEVRAAELAKRVENYNALSGKALDVASLNAPVGFITYANGIKTQPYLVNLPENTILRIEGKPTKGYKNPANSQFILLPDGTWRRMELSGNNWKPYYPGGNTLSSVVGVLANSKPSEIHVIRPGTKEHDRYMDKARENDDVTPAVLELLREYMSGSRKKDAPKGIIRKYKGSDFHLLARALSAGLIERADKNDPEAIKLTQKGLDRL